MKKFLLAAAAATLMLPAAAMAERDGATVYSKTCVACHASGAAGAPMVGKADEWGPRAALGMDTLLASVKGGKGAMPPLGFCQDCSDTELQAAIQHMIDNSK